MTFRAVFGSAAAGVKAMASRSRRQCHPSVQISGQISRMSRGLQTWCRVAGWMSLAVWFVALFQICYAIPPDEIGTSDWSAVGHLRGYDLLFMGWFGPLVPEDTGPPGGNLAWYANPCLFWNTTLLLRGRAPNVIVGLIGLLLAAPALHPFHVTAFLDDHGANGPFRPRAGAYIWVASLVPAVVLWVACRLIPDRSKDDVVGQF